MVYYLLDGIMPQKPRFQAISSVVQSAANLVPRSPTAKGKKTFQCKTE